MKIIFLIIPLLEPDPTELTGLSYAYADVDIINR